MPSSASVSSCIIAKSIPRRLHVPSFWLLYFKNARCLNFTIRSLERNLLDANSSSSISETSSYFFPFTKLTYSSRYSDWSFCSNSCLSDLSSVRLQVVTPLSLDFSKFNLIPCTPEIQSRIIAIILSRSSIVVKLNSKSNRVASFFNLYKVKFLRLSASSTPTFSNNDFLNTISSHKNITEADGAYLGNTTSTSSPNCDCIVSLRVLYSSSVLGYKTMLDLGTSTKIDLFS